MSEWWTYRPEDFLMFAPRTYWRLLELHNQAWWPLQVFTVAVGLALLFALWRGQPRALRGACVVLALGWAFVGWFFVWQRYVSINWAAATFAWGFAALALGLAVLSTQASLAVTTQPARRLVGLALVLWAVLFHPGLAPALGRPWTQAEVFGLAPDPTALATLGALLFAQASTGGARVLLLVLRTGAAAWCAVSAATLATMGSPQAWVMLVALGVATVALVFTRAQP